MQSVARHTDCLGASSRGKKDIADLICLGKTSSPLPPAPPPLTVKLLFLWRGQGRSCSHRHCLTGTHSVSVKPPPRTGLKFLKMYHTFASVIFRNVCT